MRESFIPGARYVNENTCEFVVWSPLAQTVKLIISNPFFKELVLKRKTDNYWHALVPDCSQGIHYFYKIDDHEPLPDPASVSQPSGIKGPSEVLRLTDMNWDDQEWQGIPTNSLIIYELHIGTFTLQGTFESACSKLDYLSSLGVNAIEIMPVAQFSGFRNWGYDGVFPFAVQNNYGGAFGLMNLVNECHKRGIAVILDVVYNHHGPEGNNLEAFGPYMSRKHSTPWGKAFNFDGPYCEGVRNFFIQNALMWLREFHIDGLRMDAVHAMHDNSEKNIIREISEAVLNLNNQTGKNHFLIGEVNLNDVRYTKSTDQGGYGLDIQWNDDFHHSLHVRTTGEKNGYYKDFTNSDSLFKAYKDAFVLKGQYSLFRNRKFGKPAGTTPADKFIVYSQNHDQVGNRRHGERKSTLVSFEMQKTIAVSVLLSPYVPMIFMGEEYGETNPFRFFIDLKSTYLKKMIREGREREFKMLGYKIKSEKYDPASTETFNNSKLNWQLYFTDETSKVLLDFYKMLIKIRKNHPVFKVPDRRKLKITESGKLLVLRRWQGRNRIIMFINFGKKGAKYKYDFENRSYFKILDTTDINWLGKRSDTPENLISGNHFIVLPESVIIYSTCK